MEGYLLIAFLGTRITCREAAPQGKSEQGRRRKQEKRRKIKKIDAWNVKRSDLFNYLKSSTIVYFVFLFN